MIQASAGCAAKATHPAAVFLGAKKARIGQELRRELGKIKLQIYNIVLF
jgi:hypothetical protein